MTCAGVVRVLEGDLRWEVRSAGKGSKGQRWYAWAWIDAASPRHHVLVRRHLRTGELAYRYCFVPGGQPAGMTRLVRAAGLRWPVEEDFEFAKAGLGLDQSQVRLYTAITRHTVLVTAALAICAVTAALLKDRAGSQAPPPVRPGQEPPPDPGMIPLTVPEVRRLIAAATARPWRPGHGRALVRMEPRPPGQGPMVPPAHPARKRPGNHHERPGHIANGGCRTRQAMVACADFRRV